jgi:methyl-accepting chemotaxis protein
MVDYYMEVHWNREEYYRAVDQFGVSPDNIGTELDHWLPNDTSQGVRGALNMAFAVSTGLVDAVILGAVKSIPGVGIIANLALTVRDIWKTVRDYGEVGDGVGGTIQVVRSLVDFVGSTAGNISDTCTLVEDVAGAIAGGAAATIVGAPVAAVAGTIAAGAAGIGEIADAFGVPCDAIKVVLDVASLVWNVVEARRLEGEKNFRAAAKHREFAAGDALNIVIDGLALASSAISALSVNTIPGEVGENFLEGAKDMRDIYTRVMSRVGTSVGDGMLRGAGGIGDDGLQTGGEWTNRGSGLASGVAGLNEGFANLKYRIGLGDAMALSPNGLLGGRYIEPGAVPSGSGQAGGILSAARQETVAHFTEVHSQLDAGNPVQWTQKLINDVLHPPESPELFTTFNNMLSPTYWITGLLSGIRHGVMLANDLTFGGVSSLLQGAAGTLQELVGPAIDGVNAWLRENKEPLDQYLQSLAESMSQQQVTLQSLREGVSAAQDFTGQLDQVADQNGSLYQFSEQIISQIERLRINPRNLGIPSYIPECTYMWAVERVNSLVDRVAGYGRNMRDRALQGIDSFIEEKTAWAREALTQIQEAIAEGGEVEQMMQAAYQQATQMFQQLVDFIDSMDQINIDIPGAVAWLTAQAESAQSMTTGERLKAFQEHMQTVAQPYVDNWRSTYGPAVEEAYAPEVPGAEIDAIEQAHTLVSTRLGQLTDALSQGSEDYGALDLAGYYNRANDYRDQAVAQRGAHGRVAIETVWEAGDNMAELAASIQA